MRLRSCSPGLARTWWRRHAHRRAGRARRRDQGGGRHRDPGALETRDYDGIARLAAAIDERYERLDILIGNAALGGSNSPLDHFQPSEWDEVMAVNVTANWQLIRRMDPLLKPSDAGRAVF